MNGGKDVDGAISEFSPIQLFQLDRIVDRPKVNHFALLQLLPVLNRHFSENVIGLLLIFQLWGIAILLLCDCVNFYAVRPEATRIR